jgi:hypothetical protein
MMKPLTVGIFAVVLAPCALARDLPPCDDPTVLRVLGQAMLVIPNAPPLRPLKMTGIYEVDMQLMAKHAKVDAATAIQLKFFGNMDGKKGCMGYAWFPTGGLTISYTIEWIDEKEEDFKVRAWPTLFAPSHSD